MWFEEPLLYFANCSRIVSVPAVFFRIRNPRLFPLQAAPVNGSASGVEQLAGSIVICFVDACDVSVHSDPPIVSRVPFVQFGLKYVPAPELVTHVMTPAAFTSALPNRALTSDLFNG